MTEYVSPDERLEQMITRLKESDNRVTPQRYAVIKVLAHNFEQPSAEDIHTQLLDNFPTMSLATVYKDLALRKKQGEVLELEFSDLGNRYDGNKPYPHPHVICTGCGAIVDSSSHDFEEISQKMMDETGFKIVAHRFDFYGLCPDCQSSE